MLVLTEHVCFGFCKIKSEKKVIEFFIYILGNIFSVVFVDVPKKWLFYSSRQTVRTMTSVTL